MNYFTTLNSINVTDKIEKKNNLSYLSWAWCWGEVKKFDQRAFYTIYEDTEGKNYHTDGRTAWVKTGVTVHFPVPFTDADGNESLIYDELEHIEYLPVMDFRNNSIPLEKITSTDVNKAIQRSLTKACARHGLGLYIYAGEDLPEITAPDEKITQKEVQLLEKMCYRKGVSLNGYKGKKFEDLTGAEYAEAMKELGKKKDAE